MPIEAKRLRYIELKNDKLHKLLTEKKFEIEALRELLTERSAHCGLFGETTQDGRNIMQSGHHW